MQSKILATCLAVGLSGCVAGEYNGPAGMDIMRDDYAGKSYAFTTSSDVARVGETSQRFEIRHGDCGSWDCRNDRRRIEINQYGDTPNIAVGSQAWYGLSIYLPQDFQDITPSNTHVGQAKLIGGSPLWMLSLRYNHLFIEHNDGSIDVSAQCQTLPLSQMRGRWTDIVIFADFSTRTDGNAKFQAWVNGQMVCNDNRPMVSPQMARASSNDRISLRYGIYNSFVSRWLDLNKTRSVQVSGFTDNDADGGMIKSSSVTGRPFEIDWGVQLPTQVVYYDEVRIGRSREEVDVRMRHPN